MNSDLAEREQAQLGLKYIEDSIVDLLTRHPGGMPTDAVADTLGLGNELGPEHRQLVAAGMLEMLVRSGRIIWDAEWRVYRDNRERS